jgi:precorrin-6B methylase 2
MRNNIYASNEIFGKYSLMIGSDQIATKLALRLIADYLDDSNPKTILEIGSGIGTITELLVDKCPEATIYCFEINEWCLTQLRRNVTKINDHIIDSQEELLELDRQIDLVVIDDLLDKKTTFNLITNTSPSAVFIEGHRRQQRLFVMQAIKASGKSFRFKNFKKSSDSYKGGCLITLDSVSNLSQLRYFLFVYLTLVYSKILEIRSRIPLRKLLGMGR